MNGGGTSQSSRGARGGRGGPDTLMLLVHGRADLVAQAQFCILTFQHFALRTPGRYRVVVYTDRAGDFNELGDHVETVTLAPELLQQWRGPDDYVHRIKAEALLHFAQVYGSRVMFVDSDTYFMRDPAYVFDRVRTGVAALHLDEGPLSARANGNARRLHDFVRRTALPLPDGSTGKLPEDVSMWNSGVVCLAPEDQDLLAPSLRLIDELYRRYRKHNMEQLALSYVLSTRVSVLPSDDVVYHYWGRTAAFAREADRFFAAHAGATLAERAAAAYVLAPKPAANPKPKWYHRLLPRRWR